MAALFSRSTGNPSHNLPPISTLFEKRLVFVTGKGGVGKTTVAVALGLAAARRGLRTIVCEVAHQERVSGVLGREGVGYEETEIAENLSAISLDQQHTLEEWVTYQLPSRTLASLLYKNRVFQHLTAAAPGIKELVTIGKIWELAQLDRKTKGARPYDFVVVDSPATGHGLGMLRAPRTFGDIARVGPIRHQADRIHDFIVSKRTGVLAVALPEEMPVNETLEYGDALRTEMGMELDAIVVNGMYPQRFSGADAERIAAVNGEHGSPEVAAALRAALTEHRRAKQQRTQLRRLRSGAKKVPLTTLPFLFEPELHLGEVERLSHELERKLA
jgi:anion-transporting  ArsA/GET3 family ATPase